MTAEPMYILSSLEALQQLKVRHVLWLCMYARFRGVASDHLFLGGPGL